LVNSALYEAELALHISDGDRRRALGLATEPVSILDAFRDAHGQPEVRELFTSAQLHLAGHTCIDARAAKWKVAHRHADTVTE
jgi:hypothetical protein